MKLKAIVLMVGMTALCSSGYAQTENAKIKFFQGTYEEALKEAKKNKKHVLLDFWAAWCKPCLKLDNETFTDEGLYQHINDNYVAYRINIDYFEGMEMADKFEVDGFPTLIVLNHKGKYVYRLKGFYPANYLMNELKRPIKPIALETKQRRAY